MINKWTRRFLRLAREVSTWSVDPSTQVGAVVVNDERVILSTGWNGFPRKMADTEKRLNDRDFKYRHVVHSEINAVTNAARVGTRLHGSTMFVYGLPVCPDCAKAIVQAGVKAVVMCVPVSKDKWEEDYLSSQALFDEVGVSAVRIDQESLDE